MLQLRSFIEVVERGGFTAASRQLGMSQPAVSRAVATLENEFGLALLRRGQDGITLTEGGARILVHVREALRHLTLMESEVATITGQVVGTMRVASLETVTGTLLARQLKAFGDRHRVVAIRLFEGSEWEVRDWLDHGAADVGVVHLPAKGLATAVLGEQEMAAVLPARHRLAAADEVTYEQLADEPFIQCGCGCAEVVKHIAQQLGVNFEVEFETREITPALEMVGAELGVSVLPSTGLPEVPSSVVIKPLTPRTVRTLGVAVSASAPLAARAFLDYISSRNPTLSELQ